MFKFHKLALQNAKPQHAKILLFTIVSFVILFALTILTFMPVQPALYKFAMAMAMQQSIAGSIFILILTLLVPLLFFVFIGYPLISGTIYTIDKAINKDKVNFKDLFSTFKKGKYAKSLKLSLFALIFIILLLVVNILLSKLLNLGIAQLFGALQGPLSSSDHALGISLTLQIIAATLVVFIQSFIYWFITILIINFTLAFIKDPNKGAWGCIKRGFKGIKNGRKTWLKFFIGLLLLNLLVIILANPVSQLISIGTGSISQKVALTIIYIVSVLVILIRLAVYYTNMLAIIQYYNHDGEAITSTENKKDKKTDQSEQQSKVKNSISNQTEKSDLNNTKEDVQNNVKSNLNDKTDDVQNKSSELKDQFNKSDK